MGLLKYRICSTKMKRSNIGCRINRNLTYLIFQVNLERLFILTNHL